jgi:putative DNA primase/helicase
MGGSPDLVAYLRRLIGYSLIGTQSEQKFWMWVGRGANGKGVLARTLATVFGDYAETPADTMYMRTKLGAARSESARPDLMRLQAVRFTYMSEPPGNQFNEEMLKAHTGEDTIIARDLYGKAGQMAVFQPTHKIVFLTNDPPKTDDVGVSMSRRVRVVRFEKDYSGRPDLVMPDGSRIKSHVLEDTLKGERQGILNIAIREALAWMTEGMPEPALVQQWSREYIEENDPLGQFIKERCEVGRSIQGPAASLWASYEDWAAQRGVDAMSQTGFGLAMSRKHKKVRRETGNVYFGIRAKSAAELADDEG